MELVPEQIAIQELIAAGLTSRPELAQHQSIVRARIEQLRQESARPWLPYIQIGASGGIFGGGRGSRITNTGGRSDVDLLAVWELTNLGLGNILQRRERQTELREAELEVELMQDRVIAEVVSAAADVASYKRKIEGARRELTAARRSYVANLDRIRNAVGVPIELLQAIRARTDAQNAYSRAIGNYNRAQYQLFTAIGQTPVATAP